MNNAYSLIDGAVNQVRWTEIYKEVNVSSIVLYKARFIIQNFITIGFSLACGKFESHGLMFIIDKNYDYYRLGLV